MELSIDTAGDLASVALSERGGLVAESTWRCQANHSAEVLPAVDRLLASAGVRREDLHAIFACRGPGSYSGLRAGLSLAMSLAFALRIDILGVGRLESEAYQFAVFPGPVCAVHRAGRGEIAWAAYAERSGDLEELEAPQICWPEQLPERAPSAALYCGEIDDALAALLRMREPDVRIANGSAAVRRAGVLAELAWRRYARGEVAPGGYVEPLYLREPQITESRKSLLPGIVPLGRTPHPRSLSDS